TKLSDSGLSVSIIPIFSRYDMDVPIPIDSRVLIALTFTDCSTDLRRVCIPLYPVYQFLGFHDDAGSEYGISSIADAAVYPLSNAGRYTEIGLIAEPGCL